MLTSIIVQINFLMKHKMAENLLFHFKFQININIFNGYFKTKYCSLFFIFFSTLMYIFYSSKKIKVKTDDGILGRTYSNTILLYFDERSKFCTK